MTYRSDAAHKKDKVRAWLARHPRWTFHFTPTSCSWRGAVYKALNGHTLAFSPHGEDARPFVWKADPDDIIAARNRGDQTLESIH